MQDTEAIPGVKLTNEHLRIRVVDNAPRFIHFIDFISAGANGLAALFDRKHHKNIFSSCGLQYVAATPRPAGGKAIGTGNGPTKAPLSLKQTGPETALLSQRGEDATGLNAEIEFKLGSRHVDQTVTVWSDCDLEGFDTFWSSQLNQVQCTSLFLQGRLQNSSAPQWLEAASAGHSADNRVYYRPFDPRGKSWADHVADNPVLRQYFRADEATIAATLKAGFVTNEPNKCPFTGFYYGIIDDYCYLQIFREPAYYFWISCSGATQRNPSWDYGIADGAMKAGERRSYHTRLIFKPFAGVDDILQEVRAFRGNFANTLCGNI